MAGVLVSFFHGLHEVSGELLLPLAAAQLLWVNVVTDGPPALASGLDRDPRVMRRRPRDPKATLLDPASLRFIVTAGAVKAAVGGALLVGLPLPGHGLGETRTLLFLYMTAGQPFYAYPARRLDTTPGFNAALHLSVLLGTGLQLATVTSRCCGHCSGWSRPPRPHSSGWPRQFFYAAERSTLFPALSFPLREMIRAVPNNPAAASA